MFARLSSISLSSLLAGLLLLAAALTSTTATAADSNWKAGASRVNITPEKLMWMSGYGSRSHPAEGKLVDLWCKVLVLEDASGNRGAQISLDLVGIDRTLSQTICQKLEKQHGLTRGQVAICTSHTHTGPVVGMNLAPLHYLTINKEQQAIADEYVVTLEKNVLSAVAQAIKKLAPAKISWGSGHCGFATNRRTNSEANVPKLRALGQLNGPTDHDVPVLAVRDLEGNLVAVSFGYACHSTVLSFYQWSGDYPGFAQIEVEKKHPDCVALFWAGCGADQNPLPRRTVELAQEYGSRLANAVEETLVGVMRPLEPKLKTGYEEIDLPLDTLPTRDQIEKDTTSKNKYTVARAKMLLAQIDSGKPLSQTYPYPVQVWQLGGGEVQFVTLGGEVVIDYALRIKSELKGRNTWVAGYSNDVMAYIPSRRVLREGGYEGGGSMVYYGLPTIWAPALENNILDSVHKLSK